MKASKGILVVLIVTIIYILTFRYSYSAFGSIAGSVIFILAGICGYLYGIKAGVISSVIGILINQFLFFSIKDEVYSNKPPVILASLFTIGIGVLFGYLRNLLNRLEKKSEELSLEKHELVSQISARELAESNLQIANIEMEHRVIERTVELSRVNISLEEKIDQISAMENELRKNYEQLLCTLEERKIIEMELRKAKEDAEKSDRLKSEFLAQISHEIRTPINSILCFTSLLKEMYEEKIDPDLKPSFSIIEKSSRRLIRTIDLLLHMSQIQCGCLNLQLKDIDLSKDIIEPVMLEYYNAAKQNNIELGFENSENGMKIKGDPETIRQICVQLVDNAIKFTPKGKVLVREFTFDGHPCFSVSDTGIGISEQYLNKMFEPFSQEDTGYTRRYEGNGLGLALTKKYCELNNAQITVNSQKGKGSEFTVIFN